MPDTATATPIDRNNMKELAGRVEGQIARIKQLLSIAVSTTDTDILPALNDLIQLEIEELKRQSDALADLLRSGAKETMVC